MSYSKLSQVLVKSSVNLVSVQRVFVLWMVDGGQVANPAQKESMRVKPWVGVDQEKFVVNSRGGEQGRSSEQQARKYKAYCRVEA